MFAKLLVLLFFASELIAFGNANAFPSASAAWCIPGGQQIPTDPTTLLIANSTQAVVAWELSHADIAFGADYGVQNNKKIVVLGYMYNQMLEYDPTTTEMSLKLSALSESVDYENFFLHFVEDTEFIVEDVTLSSWTSLFGVPWVFGWTNGPTHAGFSVYWSAPWNIQPWQYSSGGGAVFVISFERFDSITLKIGFTYRGRIIVEYVSATTGSSRRASEWSTMQLTSDTSRNLSTSGTISWNPPLDWKIASYCDGTGMSYGGGQFFGNSLLQAKGVGYAIRIRWIGPAPGPTLNLLLQRRWIRFGAGTNGTLQIVPGWDARNDRNGDGYVDSSEYASLVNPKATARMRQESRAFTLGQMWSTTSSGCRVNLWNSTVVTYLAEYQKRLWAESGFQGAYNDDMLKALGASVFPLIFGGTLAEFPGNVNSTTANLAYQQAFAALLELIAKLTKSKWVSGNISGVNLFTSNSTRAYVNALSTLLQEAYLTAGIGLTGYFGIQKMWDTFVYAKAGKNTLIQGQAWSGAVQLISKHSQENWERDLGTLLALFYLINIPGSTTFNAWGNGYYYGSANTFTYNYYKAGVPMNMAYQPTQMMKIDIGVPINSSAKLTKMTNREFMAFQVATTVPPNGYTVIGYSNISRVTNPELSPRGYLDLTPPFIYYLQRTKDHPQIPMTPLSCVLAREYTNGLILYRSDVYGASLSYLLSNVTVTLPNGGPYRRVHYNGSLGPVTTTVTLGGYEGAIFVNVHPGPSVSPTAKPSVVPSIAPIVTPSASPLNSPSVAPSIFTSPPQSFTPTSHPIVLPTTFPSLIPIQTPTSNPSTHKNHTYSATNGVFRRDGVPFYLGGGVNALHVFGLAGASEYSLMKYWNIKIVREFIGNLRQNPISGQTWATKDIAGSYLWPLQMIVQNNRANGLITILCPFGWIDENGVTYTFSGLNPSSQPFYSAYKARMRLIAQNFANQSDVFIEVWNEPYTYDNSNGYADSLWLRDMLDMVGNLRNVQNFNNIILVPGNGQGQLENAILDQGHSLLKEYPKNIVFDLHAYEKWMIGTTSSSIEERISTLKANSFVIMFGECGVIDSSGLMDVEPFLQSVHSLQVSTLAWLWNYNGNDQNSLLNNTGGDNNLNNLNWGTRYRLFLLSSVPSPSTFLNTTFPTSSPPTFFPTSPAVGPSNLPLRVPTTNPTAYPSLQPSNSPTVSPTAIPSHPPVSLPSTAPSVSPSSIPSAAPRLSPLSVPTGLAPSATLSEVPSIYPSITPFASPTVPPSLCPSTAPSTSTSTAPFKYPSSSITIKPSSISPLRNLPSPSPTSVLSNSPSLYPTLVPAAAPSPLPHFYPTITHTTAPFMTPTVRTTSPPTIKSLLSSICPNHAQTAKPTVGPSSHPTSVPTRHPSVHPASNVSTKPTGAPSTKPLVKSTSCNSVNSKPSNKPSPLELGGI